jgi:predicted ATPase/class 3 adenylate cyclase
MDDLNRINAQTASVYAFLFSDIEGSTSRWARFPAEMGAALARHDALLRAAVGQAGGAVFKTTGDGGYAVFSTVTAALEAAAALQIRLREEDFGAIGGMKLRVGVHCGPASFRDGDYYGFVLSRTARIMAAGHGGQVLVSAAAAAAARAAEAKFALRSLGAHRLKDLGQAEEIFQLAAPGLAAEFPPLRALDARPNNLPLQTSVFIGREAELAELRGLLSNHKLVTLLGPGGIGKTRLALQAAADALDDFADGVFLVELAGVTQGELVPASAAAALNITLGGGDTAEQMAACLRGAAMLIVLDNCEHLIEAASALAEAILRRNAGVKILATSRSPLGLPGEQSFALPALAVPDAAVLPGITAEAAAGFAGIQLFVARAALVQPGFVLEAGNAGDIAAICQRLDGIALAIELAAARIRLLRPKDLLARLNDRFRLLTGGARTHLPRQQTLRALIDWSFELLTESERVAFRRLGVFAGSFDFSGAEAVLPGGPIGKLDVLDLVASLLDKSLLTRLPSENREPRYRLLDSTRHYALEKLEQAGESAALRRAHAEHMVMLFGEARRRYPDTGTLVWQTDVEPEIENLKAALAWAFGDGGDDAIAVALAARLWPLARHGFVAPAAYYNALRAAVAKLAPDTPDEDAAALWRSLAADRSAGARAQAGAAERARALFERLQDRQMAGYAAASAALDLMRAGDAAEAQVCADAARVVLQTSPQNVATADTLNLLGNFLSITARDATDFAAARHDYAAAVKIYEKMTNQAGALIVSNNLAEVQAMLGDYAGAIETAHRIAAQTRARRDERLLTNALVILTNYHLLAGDDAAAAHAAREALPLLTDQDDKGLDACFTGGLALLAARLGGLEPAAILAGNTRQYYLSNQLAMEPVEQRVWDALMALFAAAEATGNLSPATREEWLHAGAALSVPAALKLPLPL